jgi:hypothetical protein
MNCCFSDSASFAASVRAMMSVPPPGAKPTRIRTGFVGYAEVAEGACANDARGSAISRAERLARTPKASFIGPPCE